MKADYYVVCNTYFLPLMMRYIKVPFPILRANHNIYCQSFGLDEKSRDNLALMNGLWTFLTPDNLPVVGPSFKFKNLFYNFANLDTTLES